MIEILRVISEFDSILWGKSFTSTEIAKRLKLAKSTITNYRNGKRKITLKTFIQICDVCKIHPASMLDECLAPQGVPRYASLVENKFKKENERLKYLENRTISQSLGINKEVTNKEVQVDKQSQYMEILQYRYAMYLSQNQEKIMAIEAELKSVIQRCNGYSYESNTNNEIVEELQFYIHELTYNDPESLPLKDYLSELRQLICLMRFRHKLQNNQIEMGLLIHYVESKYDSIESFAQIANIKDVLQKHPPNSIFIAELDALYFGVDHNGNKKKDPLEEIEYEF
jgi:transcriptional regulator with XRE-family HTH domain